MTAFRHGHATHADAQTATTLVLMQLGNAVSDSENALGLVYLTPPLAAEAEKVLAMLRAQTGVRHWAGSVGQGVVGSRAEYVGEPGLSVMICELPPQGFQVFSGRSPLPRPGALTPGGAVAAQAALVHMDPGTMDAVDLVGEMALKVASGQLFGGLASGPASTLTLIADAVIQGGLSGVAFSSEVGLKQCITQGCTPLAASHVVSDCSANLIRGLDGRPALDVLLDDLGVDESVRTTRDGEALIRALPMSRLRSGLFVGLGEGDPQSIARPGRFDYVVRNLVGVDPRNRLLAVAAQPNEGDRVVFCTRDLQAARTDLIRACTELREELETDGLEIRGGVYVSCVARGRALFGKPSAEVGLIQSQLGDFPLVGFFAK